MGSNSLLKDVVTFGYKTEAVNTAVEHDIPGKTGRRTAIRAFGATSGADAEDLYFFQAIGATTLSAVAASGATAIAITAKAIIGSAAVATADNIVIKLDNGAYHFTTLSAMTTSLSVTIANALTDSAASGSTVYGIGIYTDSGHIRYTWAASTSTTKELDGGLMYNADKGYPMMAHLRNAGTDAASIDYIVVEYLDI